MACRLIGAKPLLEPMLEFVNWTHRKKLWWNFNQNSYILIQENAFENIVCETAIILSRPRRVNGFAESSRVVSEPMLILLVPKLQLSGKTSSGHYSLPWLMIIWRLRSPDHQQPCYWLKRDMRFFKEFKVLSYCREMIKHANLYSFVIKTMQRVKGFTTACQHNAGR